MSELCLFSFCSTIPTGSRQGRFKKLWGPCKAFLWAPVNLFLQKMFFLEVDNGTLGPSAARHLEEVAVVNEMVLLLLLIKRLHGEDPKSCFFLMNPFVLIWAMTSGS